MTLGILQNLIAGNFYDNPANNFVLAFRIVCINAKRVASWCKVLSHELYFTSIVFNAVTFFIQYLTESYLVFHINVLISGFPYKVSAF